MQPYLSLFQLLRLIRYELPLTKHLRMCKTGLRTRDQNDNLIVITYVIFDENIKDCYNLMQQLSVTNII